MLSACTFGLFLLALYRHTGKLWLVITAHGLNNFIATFFDLFSESEALFGTWVNYVVYVLAEFAIGLFILVKYGYVEKRAKSPAAYAKSIEE